MIVKRVYKYGTGDIIPEKAIYLCSKVQRRIATQGGWEDVWLVWHYFLIENKD